MNCSRYLNILTQSGQSTALSNSFFVGQRLCQSALLAYLVVNFLLVNFVGQLLCQPALSVNLFVGQLLVGQLCWSTSLSVFCQFGYPDQCCLCEGRCVGSL